MAAHSIHAHLPEPYRFDLVDTDGTASDRCRDHMRAVCLGFHVADPDDRAVANYCRDSAGRRLREVRTTTPDLELGGLPVATLTSYDLSVNTGHGHLEPADFITDVTVRATHRRRGLLRALMTHDLSQARESGTALATLTATEGAIYGRFGFGVATRTMSVEVTGGRHFSLIHDPAGSIELADPGAIDALRVDVFTDFHARHRGSHGRLDWHTNMAAGRYQEFGSTPNRRLRSALHRDPAGRADGVVSYEVTEDFGSQLTVHDMVAANPDAELALWDFLTSVDLVTTVRASHVDPATPLPWAARDPRMVRITGMSDLTWLRILDVRRALEIRGWDHAGSVAFHLTDPLGWCQGTWRIDVAAPGAQPVVTELDDATDAPTMDVGTLGSLYFGLAGVRSLAAAGRVLGTPDEITALHRFFATVDTAHNISYF